VATIKLQDGKVITKVVNGATVISCECCGGGEPPPDCCYYPAASLGIEYLREDLPETFTIRSTAYSSILSMSLTNSGPNIYEATDSAGNLYRMAVNTQLGSWELEGQSRTTGQWSGVQDWGPRPCLFWDYSSYSNANTEQPTWPLIPPDPQGSGGFTYPDDDFEDAYEVDAYTLPLEGPIESEPIAYTRLIVRKSLCEWGPVDEEFPNLLYNGTTEGSPDRTELWTFDYYFRSDGGPYNSPEGQYFSPSNIFLVRKA
jgi:hypothetical protein